MNKKPKQSDLPDNYQPGFLFKGLDRRTEVYKVLAVIHDEIVSDLGGRDEISHTRLALVERFVFLEAVIQRLEAQIINSKELDPDLLGKWIQALNSISGLAKTVGLDRKIKKVINLREYAEQQTTKKPRGRNR